MAFARDDGSVTTPAADCPKCRNAYGKGQYPNYDHVHGTGQLPRARRTDSHIIVRGYATGMAGNLPQVWVFFEHLEPAVVFGRAGRMSISDISSYGVYEAARESRYDRNLNRDVRTLHINFAADFRNHDEEGPILERWLRGCDPRSAYFERPADRTASGSR
jgi:hypothetical protein